MKKFKKVMLIWTIVYGMITGLIYLLHGWLDVQPIFVRTLVLSAIMVFGLQYLIFPLMDKIKHLKMSRKWKH